MREFCSFVTPAPFDKLRSGHPVFSPGLPLSRE
jgi:hypothetical protein